MRRDQQKCFNDVTIHAVYVHNIVVQNLLELVLGALKICVWGFLYIFF